MQRTAATFDDFRRTARRLIHADVEPDALTWIDGRSMRAEATGSLFGDDATLAPPIDDDGPDDPAPPLNVPPAFAQLAQRVACHSSADRWPLLYRMLWRIVRGGERTLIQITVDDDVHAATALAKAVRRDAHKMKAFVRFREIMGEDGPRMVAWHRPDHHVVELTADFFVDRFGAAQDFSILTPSRCLHSTAGVASFTDGVDRTAAPSEDAFEEFWLTYYGAIFNPARIMLRAMKSEMPVKHWPTLPETKIIGRLLHEAPERVQTMVAMNAGFPDTAERYLPPAPWSLPQLRTAADRCRGCHLCEIGTQTVFGEGPAQARLMLVGEQPGDQEDRAARPFVGPAGQVLDRALAEAGVERTTVYVTNAVKHFKHTPRGKRRIHAKPDAREVNACRPWLVAEIEVVNPTAILALGATAAQSLYGRSFRLTKHHGEVFETEHALLCAATIHPSAILRIPDQDAADAAYAQLVSDLRTLHAALSKT